MPPVVPLPSAALADGDQDQRLDGLADCVRRLDPGTRALLDLSVRRRLRDDAMAPLLRTDAFHLAWRRARALERVASDLGGEQPLPLAQVRTALESLPGDAWDPLSRPALMPARGPDPGPPQEAPAGSDPADGPRPATTTALVPATPTAVGEPRERLADRLDAFAGSAPTLREAFAALGRAVGRKAVRLVIWPRRG